MRGSQHGTVVLLVSTTALLSTISATLSTLVDPRTGAFPCFGPPASVDAAAGGELSSPFTELHAYPEEAEKEGWGVEQLTPPAAWSYHTISLSLLAASTAMSAALPVMSPPAAVCSAAVLCLVDPVWLGLHLSFLHHRSQTTCWQRNPINITFVREDTAIMLPSGQVIDLSDQRLQGGPLIGRGPLLWAVLHLQRRFDPLERACIALESALAAFAVCAIVHLCTFALMHEKRAQTCEVDSVLRRLPVMTFAQV